MEYKNIRKLPKEVLILGDSLEHMKSIPDDSVDLVFTSPPYAERRKSSYGGIPEDKYVEWFLPFAREVKRILKPTGSFFLNIKPHTHKGERSLYVFDLVCALKRDVGFMFAEEYCWTKNAFPTGTKGRFKNGFEPIYHFTKRDPSFITFNPLACGTPLTEASRKRAHRKNIGSPKNGSGMAIDKTNIQGIEIARPSNVIYVNNVTNQYTIKGEHSAVFPEGLVEFFVKSFTNQGDTVLDPFAGSGTTGIVSKKLDRKVILIEIKESFFELIKRRFINFEKELLK